MFWKRRKKTSLVKLIYTCTLGVVVLIFGNIFLLNSEFLEVHNPNYPIAETEYDLLENTNVVQDKNNLKFKDIVSKTRSRRLMQNRRFSENSSDQNIYSDFMGYNDLARETIELLEQTSNCAEIRRITNKQYLASGWTKAVYSGKYKDQAVAIKEVDISGHDMASCTQQLGLSADHCYLRASQKVVREVLLMQGLSHPNIIKILSYCLPSQAQVSWDESPVSMVTELGDAIDIIRLLQMSWEDRLRIAHGITKLIHYLANSPYGSLAINDFRRQQFVLVDGEVKLTDLDDLGFREPACSNNQQCSFHDASANVTIRSTCLNGHCRDLNEKKNIFNAGRHFTSFLLPHGAPPSLRPLIRRLVGAYTDLKQTTGSLMRDMQKLLDWYTSGRYLDRPPGGNIARYKMVPESDLPGQMDYRCPFSVSTATCTVSVYDQREAEDLCDSDPDCQGFVVSGKTWSGRLLAHLKNGNGAPSRNANTTLYLKPS